MDEQIKEKMKRDYLELQADEDYYKDKFEDKENKKSCGARKMKDKKKMDFITNLYNSQISFELVAAAISKQRVTISEEAIDLYGNKIESYFGVYSDEKDLSKFWKIFGELIHRARGSKMKNNKKMDFITNLYNGQFSFVLVAAAISKQRVTISEEAIDLYGNKIEGSFGVYSNEKDLSKFWKIFDELIHRAR